MTQTRTIEELESVKFGDMTKEEQRIAVRFAMKKLQRHFERPEVQAAIYELLTTPLPGEK